MTDLTQRTKWVEPKNIPSAPVVIEHDQIVQNYEENALNSDDESKLSNYDIVLDECAIPSLIFMYMC